MLLARFLRQLVSTGKEPPPAVVPDRPTDNRPRVLNVGGNNKTIPIPAHYATWNHLLLDIDPRGNPDVVCDARELDSLEAEQYDAVYCSHNLEHYYKHEGAKVLKGFLHVLKPQGFAEIRVPDIDVVMRTLVEKDMDLEDNLYVSPSGPITVRDVVYGWGLQIERSGEDFFAHKTGFTPRSLHATLKEAGFQSLFVFPIAEAFEVRALAFKSEPTEAQRAMLSLPGTGRD